MRQTLLGVFALVLVFAGGCKSVYYSTMEAFGSEKRDILSSRMLEARNSQQQAQTAVQDHTAEVQGTHRLPGRQPGDDLQHPQEPVRLLRVARKGRIQPDQLAG